MPALLLTHDSPSAETWATYCGDMHPAIDRRRCEGLCLSALLPNRLTNAIAYAIMQNAEVYPDAV
jgi:hypothetical protein